MTKEEFARFSFLRDLEVGGYEDDPEIKKFEYLPKDEQEIYLEEAQEYFKMTLDKWPLDILERMTNPS